MKKYKEIEIPAETRTVLDMMVCDLCGKSTKNRTWKEGEFDIQEVDVSMCIGRAYPDNGQSETTTFDICPGCFRDKLIPWFKSQGADPRVEDADW